MSYSEDEIRDIEKERREREYRKRWGYTAGEVRDMENERVAEEYHKIMAQRKERERLEEERLQILKSDPEYIFKQMRSEFQVNCVLCFFSIIGFIISLMIANSVIFLISAIGTWFFYNNTKAADEALKVFTKENNIRVK